MPYPFQSAANASIEAVRRRLQAEMRVIYRMDSESVVHGMVWIPKFRIEPETFGQESAPWPAQQLELGGFFVDMYANHDWSAHMAVTPKAIGQPGYLPLVSVSHADATALAQARIFYAISDCNLPTLAQWQTLALIPALLGHPIRGNSGNLSQCCDPRDIGNAEDRGIRSSVYILAGTGPNTYSLTGGPNAPHDILGNVAEWVQELVPACRLTITKTAQVADAGGISDADPSVTIDGVQDLARWPTANGFVQIGDEIIKYATFTDNGDGTAVLGGLTRGHRGTTAEGAADNAVVTLLKPFCILPLASTGFVTGCNNTTTPVAITFHDRAAHPNAPAFAAGQTIVVGTEEMVVTAVAGSVLTVTRASPTAHQDWTPCVQKPSSGMTGLNYLAYPRSWRTDDLDIEPLGLPLNVALSHVGAELGDEFRVTSIASAALAIARGGSWSTPDGGAYHGWAWSVLASNGSGSVGMRTAWTPG